MIAENSVAPWLDLRPGFYLDAAMKGAGLGLERAKIDTEGTEAADRLRQSYASLAANQAMHSQSVAAQQANAAAELALAKQKASEEEAFRQANLGVAQGHLTVAQAHQGMLDKNAADRLKQAGALKPFHVRGGLFGYDPSTGTVNTLLAPPKEVDPFTRMKYQAALSHAKSLRLGLNKPDVDKDTQTAMQKDLDDTNADIKAIESSFSGGLGGAGGATATGDDGITDEDVNDTAVSAADDLLGAGGDPALEPTEEDTQEGNVSGGTGAFKIGKYSVTPLK